MYSQKFLLFALLATMLLGGLRLTSTTTTTTFVAAMSMANQDLERYFRSTNITQTLASISEERIVMDMYTYAFINYTYYKPEPIDVSFKEEQARYGEGKIMSVRGKLVHITDYDDVSDDTACSPNILGTQGKPTPQPGVAWIALVRRGRCTFEDKVQHVYDKGAIGVIIFNDKSITNLEKMQIKGKTRNITAVITYLEVGMDMANKVDEGYDMTAAIIEGRSGMRPISSLNRTSVLFVSISFIVLMVISLVWLIFYYIQRFRYLQTKDQQSRHLCSVTKKAIMKIPTKTGKSSDDKDADSDCCAICIEAYKASDCIRVLPCKHEFHKNCIDPWLIEHRTCPMCKLDVLKFYGFVFLGSEESILEFEADPPPAATSAAGATTAATALPSATALANINSTSGTSSTRGGGALADIMRSRDFVIDFPRIFVLDAGGAVGTHDTLFPARMPERSQSTLTLDNAKDWMSAVTNKLEEQHGLKRLRRPQNSSNTRDDMQENLLSVGATETLKRRRSRSADGRYSSGFFGRKERKEQQAAAATATAAAAAAAAIEEQAVALAKQRYRDMLDRANGRRRRTPPPPPQRSSATRRSSEFSLHEFTPTTTSTGKANAGAQAHGHVGVVAVQPPRAAALGDADAGADLTAITIQLNGKGIDLN